MAQYTYIDKAGKSQTTEAADATTALKSATNIGANSGVQLVTTPAKTTADSTTGSGTTNGSTTNSTTQTQGNGTTTQSSPSPYYPRAPVTDPNMTQANASLTPTTPRTEQQIYDSERSMRQAEIDAINSKFDSYITSQTQTNNESNSEANAIARASGQAGSPDAYTGIKKTADLGQNAIDKINAERGAEIQTIFSSIATDAATKAKDEANTARTTASDYISSQAQKAQTAVKALAYKGIDPDTVKASSPTDYQNLLNMYNGDENALRADYVANIPQASVVGSPIISGSTVTYLTKDPRTGEIKTTSIDTGNDLTADKDTSVHSIAGVGIAIVNKRTGQADIIGGTQPKYKGTTASSKKPQVSGKLTYTGDTIAQGASFLDQGGEANGQTFNGRGSDGYVDPGAYLTLYHNWTSSGGLTKDFLKEYPPDQNVNPKANAQLPKYLQNLK